MAASFADAELKVMNVIWRAGGKASAREIAAQLADAYGYTRGATYALIHRCIEKGAVRRDDPGFVCVALASQDDVRAEQADKLVDTLFDGSAELLCTALVNDRKISLSELDRLRELVIKQGKASS